MSTPYESRGNDATNLDATNLQEHQLSTSELEQHATELGMGISELQEATQGKVPERDIQKIILFDEGKKHENIVVVTQTSYRTYLPNGSYTQDGLQGMTKPEIYLQYRARAARPEQE